MRLFGRITPSALYAFHGIYCGGRAGGRDVIDDGWPTASNSVLNWCDGKHDDESPGEAPRAAPCSITLIIVLSQTRLLPCYHHHWRCRPTVVNYNRHCSRLCFCVVAICRHFGVDGGWSVMFLSCSSARSSRNIVNTISGNLENYLRVVTKLTQWHRRRRRGGRGRGICPYSPPQKKKKSGK